MVHSAERRIVGHRMSRLEDFVAKIPEAIGVLKLAGSHMLAHELSEMYDAVKQFDELTTPLIDVNVDELGGILATLHALVHGGPLFDGHVPSKVARDFLVEHGFASKIIVTGAEGFNAATYKGYALFKALEDSAPIVR